MLDELRNAVGALDKLSDRLETAQSRKARLQDELAATNTDIQNLRVQVKAATQAVKAAASALVE